MNIKEYISSGIIESYVLGLASEEEKREFEQLCLKHPELVSARNDFEIALEKQLFTSSAVPVLGVKEKIMQSIHEDTAHQTRVVPMKAREGNQSRSSLLRWIAVAAVLLLFASAYFAFSYYTRSRDLEIELAKSRQTQSELDARLRAMEMVTDPKMAVINLKGMEKSPNSSASVYWDSTSSNIYLVAKNMPKPASDKQYQLWAIIEGKEGQLLPTDLGLFDVGEDGKVILRIDKPVRHADAFAITIEKRGNTAGPTLEQLQAMGKTNL